MPQIAADLVARLTTSGVSEAAAQFDAFAGSVDAAGASADAASAGIDRVGAAASGAATGLDASAGSGDAAAASLDRVAGSGDAAAASLDRVGASGDMAAAGLDRTALSSDAAGASMGGAGGAAASGAAALAAAGFAGLFLTKHMLGVSDSFQQWMQDLVSISPALQNSTDLQAKMAQTILDISTATGFTASDVQRAMYYAVSGTKTLTEAQALANEGAKLGIIGMTNATDATKLLTGTYNAFGYTLQQLPTLNDEVTKSISNGVLRLNDLQSVLPQINLQAHEMGISLPTILGGLDEMTNKGLTSFQAATEMKNLIIGFDKGGMAEFAKFGYTSGVQMVQDLGFQGAIQKIFQDIGNDPAAIAKVFPDIRKMQGFLALGSNAADWQTLIAADQNSAGEADKSLAAQEQATTFHIGVMKAKFNELAIALGDGIRPVVQTLADVFGNLFQAIAKLPAPLLHLIGAGIALGSVFATIVGGGALLEALFAGPLGAALGTIAASVTGLLAPLALVAGAVYLLYEAFQMNLFGIKDQVTNAFNAIANVADSLTTSFDRFTKVGINPISAAFLSLSTVLDSFGLTGVGNFFAGLARSLERGIETFHRFIDEGASPFMAVMEGISAFFSSEGLTGLAGFFNDLANHDWGQVFRDIASGLGILLIGLAKAVAIQIPTVTVDILGWAWGKINVDLATWLNDHLFGRSQVGDGTGSSSGPGFGTSGQGYSVDLKQLFVNVIDWAWASGVDLPGWLAGKGKDLLLGSVTTGVGGSGVGLASGGGTSGGADVALPVVHVGVLEWLWATGIPDLGRWMKAHAVQVFNGVMDIGTVAVHATLGLFSWAASGISGLVATLVGWGAWIWAQVKGAYDGAVDIGTIAFHGAIGAFSWIGLNIGNWGAWIWEQVNHWAAVVVDIGDWTLHVGVPSITGWLVILADDAWAALKAAANITTTLAGDLKDWTLNVGVPTLQEIHAGDLLNSVKGFVSSALSGWTFSYNDFKISVTAPDGKNITVDGPGIVKAVNDSTNTAIAKSANQNSYQGAQNAGFAVGTASGPLVAAGVIGGLVTVWEGMKAAKFAGGLGERFIVGFLEGLSVDMYKGILQLGAYLTPVTNDLGLRFAEWVVGLGGKLLDYLGPSNPASFVSSIITGAKDAVRLNIYIIKMITGLVGDGKTLAAGIVKALDDKIAGWTDGVSTWLSGLGAKISGIFGGSGGGALATGAGMPMPGGSGGGIWDGLIAALTPDLSGIGLPKLPSWVTDPSQLLGPFQTLLGKISGLAGDLRSAWSDLAGVLGGSDSGGGGANGGNASAYIPGMVGGIAGHENNGPNAVFPPGDQGGHDLVFNLQFLAGGKTYSDLSSAISGSMNGGDMARNGMEPIKSSINTALQDMTQRTLTAGQDINRNLTDGLKAAQTSAQGIFTGILTNTGNFLHTMQDYGTRIGGDFSTMLGNAIKAATTNTQTVLNSILTAMGNFLHTMQDYGTRAGGDFTNNLYAGLLRAVGDAQMVVSAISGILASGATSAYWSGAMMGQGFANGILSQVGAAASAATNLSNAATTTVTQRNQIASPSGLWRWYGQMNALGYALGHQDGAPLVARSVGTMIGTPSLASNGVSGSGGTHVHINGPVSITVSGAGKNGGQLAQEIYAELGAARNMLVGYNG